MFIINQHETNADQIVYFKSQSDSQRYWDFFIENKNVIPFQYVNPLLFAGKGYTYNQIQKLDFLNCIVPIPVFSCRFVKKYKELLKSELQFFPCKIKIKDKTIDFFLGRILKSDNILDLKRSGSRTLMAPPYQMCHFFIKKEMIISMFYEIVCLSHIILFLSVLPIYVKNLI